MTSFDLDLSKYDLGWNDEGVEYAFEPEKGINPGVVEQISWWKGEPRWMTDMRLRSLRLFERKPMAEWFAVNMPDIDFQDIYYYLRPKGEQVSEWREAAQAALRLLQTVFLDSSGMAALLLDQELFYRAAGAALPGRNRYSTSSLSGVPFTQRHAEGRGIFDKAF